ncbi:MAG: DHH family phosphoesterase [Nanoarchaeota archaeon]|nr:DHH family phosphoesterase [Nanoarchaeota archaeon]
MDSFFNSIKEAASQFSKIKTPIRIISHLDTDGLSSASILIKTLTRLNKVFSLSIVKQLSPQVLNEFRNEEYENYVFLDLGSGHLKEINSVLKNRTIFILDHHVPQDYKTNFTQINPHLHKLDGNKEISGAGITYLFSKAINPENKDLAYLAILGAIGDVQEDKDGFTGLNKDILQDAVSSGLLEVKKGLRMFGSQTRPLYKVLQYSTDPYIPGITGYEDLAREFLNNLRIDPNKKLIHLSEEEIKNLVSAIIVQRMGSETDPEDVLGNIYILNDKEEASPTRDLKEFSTLLNACGRLNRPSLAIGTCLNDIKSYEKALEISQKYKEEIIKSLNWFYKNKDSKSVIETPDLTIINAEDNIKDTIIGTMTSMISKSNVYPPETILLSLAHTLDNNTKISIRISGFKANDVDLREVLSKITEKIGCPAGGHKFAAGSLIPQEKEQEFINIALESFKKQEKTVITT